MIGNNNQVVNSKLKLKKGDQVKVVAGSHKGKIGKIIAVLPKENAVKVEGINIVKRHVKPNTLNPQGGITELHKPINVSKVALTQPSSKEKTSRIGYQFDKSGNKVRVYKQVKVNSKYKEIE